MPGQSYNWEDLDQQLAEAIQAGDVTSIPEAATHLSVKESTLRGHLREYGVLSGNLAEFPEVLEARLLQDNRVLPEGIHFEQDGNRAVAWASGDQRIRSLDDLIEACKVDLDTWAVDHYLANAWEMHAKVDGEARPFTNYQVKAWLVRKEPVAVMPTFAPVSFETKLPKPKLSKSKGLRRTLFAGDHQFGYRRSQFSNRLETFHDRRVLDITLQAVQIAEEEGDPYDEIVLLGDWWDQSEWTTKYLVESEFWATTQPAIIESAWWLRQLREAAPNARIIMLEGNHNRINDAIQTYLPAAYQLRAANELHLDPALSMPKLLALHEMHIEFIEGYKQGRSEVWLSPSIRAVHDEGQSSTPGATANKVSDKAVVTTWFGHIHRCEMVRKRMEVGQDDWRDYIAASPGTSCRVDGEVPGSKKRNGWQQGLGEMRYNPDAPGVPPQIVLIAIAEGRATWGSRELVARDRDAEALAVIEEGLARVGG